MTPPIRPILPGVRKALADYERDNLSRLADMAGLSQGTGDAVQSFAMGATEPLGIDKVAKVARRGIEAWHGSPYKFDKFDATHYKSGEGAHGFGRGFYFADSRRVAEGYRDALEKTPGSGKLYKVNLDVSPEELMNLDAPLNFESPPVLNSLGTILDDHLRSEGYTNGRPIADFSRGSSGGDAIREIRDMLKKRGETSVDVEDVLSKNGIHGFRYLDGDSRSVGDGTRNYVIFDPARITILERLAALGIGGQMVKDMLARAKAQAQPQQDKKSQPLETTIQRTLTGRKDTMPQPFGFTNYGQRAPSSGQALQRHESAESPQFERNEGDERNEIEEMDPLTQAILLRLLGNGGGGR